MKNNLKIVIFATQMPLVYVSNVITISERCYKLIHDVKNDPTHKKENIDPFIPIELKCPIHPQDRMNLFSVNDKGMYIIIYLEKTVFEFI